MSRKVIIEVDDNDIDDFIERGIVRADVARNAIMVPECDDCVSRQAVLNKAFEVKTGENTSAMVVYAEDIRKELPVKPKLAFNERITTIPMPFE